MTLGNRIPGFVRPLLGLRGSVMALALSLTVLFLWGPPPIGASSGNCDPCMTCSPGSTPIGWENCDHCVGSDVGVACQCCEVLDGSAQCCYAVPE